MIENDGSYSVNFTPFSLNTGLPFPLNQPLYAKCLIVCVLALNLLVGILLRTRVIKYLHTIDIEKNPINYFFWFDQVTGGVLGLYIIFTLTALVIEFPLAEIVGDAICNWTDLLGCIYLSCSTAWSFNIAVFRILLLKAPNQLKSIRRKKFVCICLTIHAVAITAICSVGSAYLDKGFG